MPARNLKYLSYIGKTLHKLTIKDVIYKPRGRAKRNRCFFSCTCECGNLFDVAVEDLFSGNTKSCGCLKKELMTAKATKHGYANKEGFRKGYRSWYAMKQRCGNPNCIKYKDYGARGITICERWMNSFENFINDMGEKPSPNHSIDRINNEGHYEPGNCKWSTALEQRINQRPKKRNAKSEQAYLRRTQAKSPH